MLRLTGISTTIQLYITYCHKILKRQYTTAKACQTLQQQIIINIEKIMKFVKCEDNIREKVGLKRTFRCKKSEHFRQF